MAIGRRRRIWIFVGGIATSIAIGGVFFLLAWLLNDAAEYAWIGRMLDGMFVALNPLLRIFQRLILRLFPTPPAAGRVAIQIGYVALFVGWWWLVAVVADHVLKRRRHDQRAT